VSGRPGPPHHLAAVRVVADSGVALDGLDAAGMHAHDDSDVVRQPAVPVEDDEIARRRLRDDAVRGA